MVNSQVNYNNNKQGHVLKPTELKGGIDSSVETVVDVNSSI